MRMQNLLLAVLGCLFVVSCGQPPEQQAGAGMQAPPVDVANPLKKEITEYAEYVGRFEAVDRVDLQARVTGYLTETNFTEGQTVSKGDLLFVIDPRPFEYELARAEAVFKQANNEYDRAQRLRKSRAISEEEYDRRSQDLAVAQAQLDQAKLDLEFSRVTSPIDGVAGEAFIDNGNLVRADDTLLTRIVSVDPMQFEFELPQDDFLKIQGISKNANGRSGTLETMIQISEDDGYSHAARLDFIDNVVDQNTGTILMRAEMDNVDGFVVPGLFGRIRMPVSVPYDALLIPEKAVNSDQDKKFVFVVNDKSQAGRAYIKLGPRQDDGMIVVRSGLNGDEKVVISGTMMIRVPNQPVAPNMVDLAAKNQNGQ